MSVFGNNSDSIRLAQPLSPESVPLKSPGPGAAVVLSSSVCLPLSSSASLRPPSILLSSPSSPHLSFHLPHPPPWALSASGLCSGLSFSFSSFPLLSLPPKEEPCQACLPPDLAVGVRGQSSLCRASDSLSVPPLQRLSSSLPRACAAASSTLLGAVRRHAQHLLR